jgi:hypothetical protein
MTTIHVKYQTKMPVVDLDLQADQPDLVNTFHGLEQSVRQLKQEEDELLSIAMRLSQAIVRVGSAEIGYDSFRQRNDTLSDAQKCRDDLQQWLARHMGHA